MTDAPSVAGCFGTGDLKFASHPADLNRAFEWLKFLREHEIGWARASEQIDLFLKSKETSEDHIREQIDCAALYIKPWIQD